MKNIFAKQLVKSTVDNVKQLFWDMQRWQKIWSPMQSVEMKYDGPLHQEILMTVDREGVVEHNRTIRFLSETEINFFSSTPPPMMSLHRGCWSFLPSDSGCFIVASREFYLLPSYFYSQEDEEKFIRNFQRRLSAILTRFSDYFDEVNRHV